MGNEFFENLRNITTYGQLLPDGRVIDLLATTADEKLEIVVWDAEQSLVVPRLEHNGILYVAPDLHPSVRRALIIPTCIADYASTSALFLEIAQLSIENFGLSEVFASIAACWIFTTWVPEVFAAPPTLCIAASSMADAMRLFHFCRSLSRRAIIAADLSPRLPSELRPTLLVVDTGLSKKARTAWRAYNYFGVYVPGSGGRLQELVCSKAIYCENPDSIASWGGEALRIVLPPSNALPLLREPELQTIARKFQPQLQRFRLWRLSSQSQATRSRCPAELAKTGLGRELFAMLAGEPNIQKLLQPVVEQEQQASEERRSVDPLAVIIEVVWIPAHEEESMAVAEVRGRLNALLRARGENLEYSTREIGWKLSDLGVRRQRTAKGMVIKFSREVRGHIHGLARQFGLQLPKLHDCSDCTPAQVVEQ